MEYPGPEDMDVQPPGTQSEDGRICGLVVIHDLVHDALIDDAVPYSITADGGQEIAQNEYLDVSMRWQRAIAKRLVREGIFQEGRKIVARPSKYAAAITGLSTDGAYEVDLDGR
jgi:hypothetical protein